MNQTCHRIFSADVNAEFLFAINATKINNLLKCGVIQGSRKLAVSCVMARRKASIKADTATAVSSEWLSYTQSHDNMTGNQLLSSLPFILKDIASNYINYID